jgi:hypothetical protein
LNKLDTQAADTATKELIDRELANLRISHENEEKVLSTQLDVEAKIQKESVSKAISNLMEEELNKISLKCVTEVCSSNIYTVLDVILI